MNLNEMLIAAPQAAEASGSLLGKVGVAGVAVLFLVGSLFLLGDSDKRIQKKLNGPKPKKVRKPVGPWNPDNWMDAGGGNVEPAKWLGPLTVILGVITMGLFIKVREIKSDSFWAKGPDILLSFTQKIVDVPMINDIGPGIVAVLAVGAVMFAPISFRAKFFMGLAVTGLLQMAGGVPTDLMNMFIDTADTTVGGVASR